MDIGGFKLPIHNKLQMDPRFGSQYFPFIPFNSLIDPEFI